MRKGTAVWSATRTDTPFWGLEHPHGTPLIQPMWLEHAGSACALGAHVGTSQGPGMAAQMWAGSKEDLSAEGTMSGQVALGAKAWRPLCESGLHPEPAEF